MEKIIKILYSKLPKSIIEKLGKSNSIKKVREHYLRKDGKIRLITEKIQWEKGAFFFTAPIRMVVKAKTKGIESKIIRNSINLLKENGIERPVVIDIGANYGFVSLALQSNLDKEAVLYSFEPHPDIFEAFKNSIQESNITNIFPYNLAIGEEDCNISLNLSLQTSNILSSEDRKVEKIITIKQVNLDSFFLEKNIKPDFIKIDVDGYEMNVLKGLEKTINNYKPILVIETNDDIRILEFIKKFNYRLLNLDLEKFSNIPNNIFCVKE